MNIGIFGLGEAGALIAADLASEGCRVMAFDPADVDTPARVKRVEEPHRLAASSDLIVALTAGQDAPGALDQALSSISPDTVYADFSTNSVEAKEAMAAVARENGFAFVDIALMSIVPGKGLKTPMLASGTGAQKLLSLCSSLPVSIEVVSDIAGDASRRKLLRSIMMKGLAATIIEALRAAEEVGMKKWLWQNIANELEQADASTIRRFVEGSDKHATRRIHEMEASCALLKDLNIEPLMASATVETLQHVKKHGVPGIN